MWTNPFVWVLEIFCFPVILLWFSFACLYKWDSVRTFLGRASACVFRIHGVGILSADSRSELCGTDTLYLRCIGCWGALIIFAWFCRFIRCSITGSTDALWSLCIGSTGTRCDCCRLCSSVEPTPFKLKRRINQWVIPCCFCAALRGCFRGRSCLFLGLLCVSVAPL